MTRALVFVLIFVLVGMTACSPSAPPTQVPIPPNSTLSPSVPPTQAPAPTLRVPTPDASLLTTTPSAAGDPAQADAAAREAIRSARTLSGLRAQLGSQADDIFRSVDEAQSKAVQNIIRQLPTGSKPPGSPAPLPPRAGQGRAAQFGNVANLFALLVTAPSSTTLPARGDSRPIESTETLAEGVRAHVKMTPRITGSQMEIDLAMIVRVEKGGTVYEEKSNGNIRLNVCPDESGHVPLDLTFQSAGSTGGAGYSLSFTQHAIGQVDEEATLVSVDLEMQTEMASQGGSSDALVQVNQQFTVGGWTTNNFVVSNSQASIPRSSPNVSGEFTLAAAKMGAQLAMLTALFALRDAEKRWQGGLCVQVTVAEGQDRRVGKSSETSFTAAVRHQFGGSALTGPVIATLASGAVSVSPAGTKVPAPAPFVYKAPDQAGETATVDLVSRSRRGIGKLTVTFTTEEEFYRVDGDYEGGRFHLSGWICALDKPFTIKIEGLNIGQGQYVGTFVFTPADASRGSWKHSATTTCLADLGCGTVEAEGTYQWEGITGDKPVLVLNASTQRSMLGGRGGTSVFPGLRINVEPGKGACQPD